MKVGWTDKGAGASFLTAMNANVRFLLKVTAGGVIALIVFITYQGRKMGDEYVREKKGAQLSTTQRLIADLREDEALTQARLAEERSLAEWKAQMDAHEAAESTRIKEEQQRAVQEAEEAAAMKLFEHEWALAYEADYEAVVRLHPEAGVPGSPLRTAMDAIFRRMEAENHPDATSPTINSIVCALALKKQAAQREAEARYAAGPAPSPTRVPVPVPAAVPQQTTAQPSAQPLPPRPYNIPALGSPEPRDPVLEELRLLKQDMMIRETQRQTEQTLRDQRQRFRQ